MIIWTKNTILIYFYGTDLSKNSFHLWLDSNPRSHRDLEYIKYEIMLKVFSLSATLRKRPTLGAQFFWILRSQWFQIYMADLRSIAQCFVNQCWKCLFLLHKNEIQSRIESSKASLNLCCEGLKHFISKFFSFSPYLLLKEQF